MNKDIFQSIQEKKSKVCDLIQKTESFGWIDNDRCKSLISKLENDIITIGVIGQMKCGKSTFLNSFVFGRQILPVATTPMTATLSIITYGAEEKIVVEFYSEEEWLEQLKQADRSLEEVSGDTLLESSIRAAKELVERSVVLGDTLQSFLGTIKEDFLDNLIDYVGAEGRYVGITKAVTIYFPDERLKGVEIVDTPGFNDPIVSREERTKAFLNKADVVLMMLYAGRPFDVTDQEILFKHVSQCGMGKVLLAINKYDIPFGNGEDEETIKQYVKEEIMQACKLSGNIVAKDYLRDIDPIPISSAMALLSQQSEQSIKGNEELHFLYNRLSEVFNIHKSVEFYSFSHIQKLSDAIMKLIIEEKEQIQFARPISTVMSVGQNKKNFIENELYKQQSIIKNIDASDDELEEKVNELSKSRRKIKKKIEDLSDELEDTFRALINEGSSSLKRIIDTPFDRVKERIKNLSKSEEIEKDINLMNQEIISLKQHDIPNFLESFGQKTNQKIRRILRDFFDDVDDIFERFLPDYDTKNLITQVANQTNTFIDMQNCVKVSGIPFKDKRSDKEKYITGGVSAILGFLEGWFLGTTDIVSSFVGGYEVGNIKTQLEASFEKLHSEIQPRPIMERIMDQKEILIEMVSKCLIQEVLTPLIEQVDTYKSMKVDRENILVETKGKIIDLQNDKLRLDEELSIIEKLKNEIMYG